MPATLADGLAAIRAQLAVIAPQAVMLNTPDTERGGTRPVVSVFRSGIVEHRYGRVYGVHVHIRASGSGPYTGADQYDRVQDWAEALLDWLHTGPPGGMLVYWAEGLQTEFDPDEGTADIPIPLCVEYPRI